MKDSSAAAGQQINKMQEQISELKGLLEAAQAEIAQGKKDLQSARDAGDQSGAELRRAHAEALKAQEAELTAQWEREKAKLLAEHEEALQSKDKAIAALQVLC